MPAPTAVASGGGGGGGGAPPAVLLRRYRASDNALVTPLWMNGFLEMADDGHARLKSAPFAGAFFAALAGAAWGLSAPVAVPAGLVGFGALVYTPIGLQLYRAALWQGIKLQALSMKPEGFEQRWCLEAPPGAASGTWDERRGAFLVAQRADDPEGRPIGCVAVKCTHTLHRERQAGVAALPREASIWRLTVAPAARGLGVGRLLMDGAEAFARREGCANMSLICGNEQSKAFYRAIGYSAETEARARAAVFGEAGPKGVAGLVKERTLRARLFQSKGILMKELTGKGA